MEIKTKLAARARAKQSVQMIQPRDLSKQEVEERQKFIYYHQRRRRGQQAPALSASARLVQVGARSIRYQPAAAIIAACFAAATSASGAGKPKSCAHKSRAISHHWQQSATMTTSAAIICFIGRASSCHQTVLRLSRALDRSRAQPALD